MELSLRKPSEGEGQGGEWEWGGGQGKWKHQEVVRESMGKSVKIDTSLRMCCGHCLKKFLKKKSSNAPVTVCLLWD